jgi:hypothetical protein
MWIVVLGLGALVFGLARKAPATSGATSQVGPNPYISATGANWVQSPATSNGRPNINNANAIALETNYQNAAPGGKVVSSMVPNANWQRRRAALDQQADYLTDANNRLMTQNVPPIVSQTNTDTSGTKL